MDIRTTEISRTAAQETERIHRVERNVEAGEFFHREESKRKGGHNHPEHKDESPSDEVEVSEAYLAESHTTDSHPDEAVEGHMPAIFPSLDIQV